MIAFIKGAGWVYARANPPRPLLFSAPDQTKPNQFPHNQPTHCMLGETPATLSSWSRSGDAVGGLTTTGAPSNSCGTISLPWVSCKEPTLRAEYVCGVVGLGDSGVADLVFGAGRRRARRKRKMERETMETRTMATPTPMPTPAPVDMAGEALEEETGWSVAAAEAGGGGGMDVAAAAESWSLIGVVAAAASDSAPQV